MMPVLRAAERSARFRRFAERYAHSVSIGSEPIETITVEKVASLCAGIVSLLLMMGAALLWSIHRRIRPWWLANVLLLAITSVTLVLRATQNYWYPYDLPHAALFGCAALLALEGRWTGALLLFALDVPMRETAIFLLPLLCAEVPLASRCEARYSGHIRSGPCCRHAALLGRGPPRHRVMLFWQSE